MLQRTLQTPEDQFANYVTDSRETGHKLRGCIACEIFEKSGEIDKQT